MEPCSITVNLTEKSFQLAGDQNFIDAYYSRIAELISVNSNVAKQLGSTEVLNSKDNSPQSESSYIERGVYRIDEETNLPIILEQVPGKNKREQMRNVAFVLLLANGNNAIDSSYIKEQCEQQSCLDSGNFSKAFSMDRKNFIRRGKPNSREWELTLTLPGKAMAKSVLDEMAELA